ncbi:MAG: hypothetical protein M3P27_03040 [Acidobacteriota bacterium]|nr:hypothetical protein [Acidobacteriota bacterium]
MRTLSPGAIVSEAIEFAHRRNYVRPAEFVGWMAQRGWTVTWLEAHLALDCSVHIKVLGRREFDGRYYYDHDAAEQRKASVRV